MITISNGDYKKVMRLLKSFVRTSGASLREIEERRQAGLLLRKWEKCEKRPINASNSKDDKLYIRNK